MSHAEPAAIATSPRFEQIRDDFEFLDDWEERYRYVIELGRAMEPLDEALKTSANKVQGCASQVWIDTEIAGTAPDPLFRFRGDSDALIVRGLIAILHALLSDRPAREVAAADVHGAIAGLGLKDHLTAQRANGLAAMIRRLQAEASRA